MKNPLVRLNLTLMGYHRQLVEGKLVIQLSDPKVHQRLAFLLKETDRLLTGQESGASLYRQAATAVLGGTPIRLKCSDEGYTIVRVGLTEPPFLRLEAGGPAAWAHWKQAGLT